MGLDLYAGIPLDEPDDEGFEYDVQWNREELHARWSYSGFNRFRDRLATAEGFELKEMAGHSYSWEPPTEKRAWETVDTPLKPLLNHSDCDGEMSSEEAAQVWPRLAQIVAGWREGGEDTYDVQAGQSLTDLLKACAENNWTVLFL